jgi:NitT/TauT family transport system permease protein
MTSLFELREKVSSNTAFVISTIGFFLIFGIWTVITVSGFVPPSLFPSPFAVLASFKELHFEDALIRNVTYSIRLNLFGYIEAIAIAIPIGFIIGLFPIFREAFNKYLDAIRFIPLTAVTGLFILWFGIEDNMKIQFLAFGIIVYLIPVVVQRVIEVDDIYVQTIRTLSNNKWSVIKHVFVPAVISKVSDDIRVLVAISWTYIIVAEMVNKSGGVGAMAYTAARQSRVDKVFAILVIIIVIGFIQDKLFQWLDKVLFPHKHIKGATNA